MPTEKRLLKVFLCHAHHDADNVYALYDRLVRNGVDAWLDKKKLVAGQDWEYEIRKAVRESDVVIVCHSKQFNQRGFRQKEVRIALEEADLLPKGAIFIIPARLEECNVLDDLKRWHWVDLFRTDGYDNLIRALRLQADNVGATLQVRKSWLPQITAPISPSQKLVEVKNPKETKKKNVEKQNKVPNVIDPILPQPSVSPLFADRYIFQSVGKDWDRGHSGFTYPVLDNEKKCLAVIKRAEIKSQQDVERLKNELAALLALKGLGVPEVYETGEAEYNSKNYFYIVIEYIEGIRVDDKLGSLTSFERAEILCHFFSILAKSHQMGIANGDVDLKHLLWRKDKKQLAVIDWGNSKLNVDPKSNVEFTSDLAHSAEIIYYLTTRKGHPPITGSIALPNEAALIPNLVPLPTEFHALCKWAPRTPIEDTQSPHTAQELYEASIAWQKNIQSAKLYKPGAFLYWKAGALFGIIIFLAVFLAISPNSPLHSLIYLPTPTPIVFASNTPLSTILDIASLTETPLATATSTDVSTLTPTVTQTPINPPTISLTPIPQTYTQPILIFNQDSSFSSNCWSNTPPELKPGLDRRDDGNWIFEVEKATTIDQFIQADFSQCLAIQSVRAMAVNVWVKRLELQRDLPENPGTLEPGKEIGFFIETANGQRREYTIWVDANKSMYFRIRENNEITLDEAILIIDKNNLNIKGAFPRLYADFPIQIFLETNNNGLDIIYLRQGPAQLAVKAEDVDPSQMILIHGAVRPNLGNIQNIGLIGYGGETQTVIWPLVIFGDAGQSTQTSPNPDESTLGNGYINKAIASAWLEPNKNKIATLGLNQPIVILELKFVSGSNWYRCRWDNNGVLTEGWILAEYITLVL